MIDELITAVVSNRTLSWLTLVLSVVLVLLMLHMAANRIIPWRYTVLPGLIAVEMIVFYFVVVFIVDTTSPSFSATFYSGLIRLQTVIAAIVFLVTYWIGKRKHG